MLLSQTQKGILSWNYLHAHKQMIKYFKDQLNTNVLHEEDYDEWITLQR